VREFEAEDSGEAETAPLSFTGSYLLHPIERLGVALHTPEKARKLERALTLTREMGKWAVSKKKKGGWRPRHG
jgi:hypothetical protein